MQNKNINFVLKGSFTTLLTMVFVQGLRFISGIIIGRKYGATVSGELTLVATLLGIFSIVANFGIKDAMQKLIPEYATKYNLKASYNVYKKGLIIISITSIICGIIIYYISPWLCHKWQCENLISLFRISGFFLIIGVLADYNYFCLRAALKINASNYLQIIPTVIRIVALLILTYFFYDKNNPIYLHWFTIMLLPWLFSLLPIYKNFGVPTQHQDVVFTPKYTTIFALALPMFATYISFLINNNADTIMLKFYNNTTADIGVYKTSFNISTLAATLLVALNTTIQPKITQLYTKGEMHEIKNMITKATKISFLVSLPIYILCIFFAKYIMQIYGNDFMVGAPCLIIFTIAQIFNTTCGPVAQLLNATGKHKTFLLISLFGAIINVVFNFILIPKYGIIGAAISNTISMIAWNVIGNIYIKKQYGFFVAYLPFFKN